MIYLDNAATTLQKPDSVRMAVAEAMSSVGNSSRGGYGLSLDASRMIYGTREKLAELFGVPRADHVIFTNNSTEALNIMLNGLFHRGDHVISTDLEHNSVLRPLYRLNEEYGIQLSFVPADRYGRMDYDDFEKLVRKETKAIVCTHASNLTGNLVDIRKISKICREHGLLFLVDASQTAGTIPIDLVEDGIDVLAFTGHKGLFGPQGTGGMCIREGVEIRPWKVGGTGIRTYDRRQPKEYPVRLEAGTLNAHGIAGLSAALDFIAHTGVSRIREREHTLAKLFYLQVKEIPGVKLYGDFQAYESKDGGMRAPIIALNIGDEDSAAVADWLAENYGIAVRAGGHCAPRMHTALGTREQGAVRFSFSYFNKEEEVFAAAAAIRRYAQ